MEPQTPATAALLQATIRQTAPAIPAADNLGETDDPRDLYYLLDYLSFAVDRAYPGIPCASGCSHCCDTQVFRVSALEWARLARAVDAMRPEAREALYARNRALYGAHRDTLGAIAAAWSAGDPADVALHERVPGTCPMLAGGRCTVYDNRPAICRGYGYFSATVNGSPSLLLCKQRGQEWIEGLEAAGVEQLPMPNWNPVQRRITELDRARHGTLAIKPLALWLLDHEQGQDHQHDEGDGEGREPARVPEQG